VSYLKTIKRFSGSDNLGGVLTILVARKDDIESIPDPVAKVIPGNLVFKAGKGFVTWDVTLETLRIRSASSITREGPKKSNSLNFLVPKDRYDLAAMFDQAEADEFIVFYRDGNGTNKLFGLLDTPVRFKIDHNSGEKLPDGNFYEAQFYFEGPDNRYFYGGTIPAAPPSTATSLVRYQTGETIAILNPSDELVVSSEFEHTFSVIPGSSSGTPAVVKWDTGETIASLQPGDTLVVDTDFEFDFEIIETA
jgi:hypothetical protein